MSLANAYAAVVRDAEEKEKGTEFVKKLIAFMKSRGHLSLLPQVLRIRAREKSRAGTPVVTVAKEADAKKFSRGINEALSALGAKEGGHALHVDPRAVGGYSVLANSRLVDRSFRSALISLYQNVISK